MVICGVLINIIVAWWYDAAILGVFNQVYAVYIVFSQFAVMGIHLSVLKYVAQYSNEPYTCRLIISTGILMSICFASISTTFFWFIKDYIGRWMDSPGVAYGMIWATPALFFFSVNKVFLNTLNGLSRMRLFATFQALRYVFMIAVLVSLISMSCPGEKLPIVFSAAEIGLFICLLSVVWPELVLPSLERLKKWMSTHFNFGLRGFFGNVLLEFNTRVDVLILGYFSSDHTVGIYSFAAIAAEGIYQFPVILRTNYNPILVRQVAEKRLSELKTTVKKGVRYTYVAMFLVGLVAVFIYPKVLFIVTNKKEFIESWPIFGILITGVVLCSGYIPFGSILLQAGHPGLQTIMILTLVMSNVVGNCLLIPIMGAIGAAIATSLSFVLSVYLIKLFVKNTLGVRI